VPGPCFVDTGAENAECGKDPSGGKVKGMERDSYEVGYELDEYKNINDMYSNI